MATTPTYINQRINNLQAQINAIISGGLPTSSDLSVVLGNGNSAGTFDIDMNNNDILNANQITATDFAGNFIPSSETISGTTAVSPTINTTFASGTTHSLAVNPVVGSRKTIINTNPNAFSLVSTTYNLQTTSAIQVFGLQYDSLRDRMYICGQFTTYSNVAGATGICYYDFATSTFVAFGTGCGGTNFASSCFLSADNNTLFLAGTFTSVDGVATAGGIAFCNLNTNVWTTMGAIGTAPTTSLYGKWLQVGTDVYYANNFTTIGGVVNTSRIARWDGAAWNALGTGVSGGGGTIHDMTYDPNTNSIWVGGNFTSASGVAQTTSLARWDITASTWNGYGAVQITTVNTIKYISATSIFFACASQQRIPTTTGPPYASSGSFDPTTNTFSNAIYSGIGAGAFHASAFLDNDGVLWCGIAAQVLNETSGGLNNSGDPSNQKVNANSFNVSFWDASTNSWGSIMTNLSFRVANFSATGTTGEYFFGSATGTAGYIEGTIFNTSALVRYRKDYVTQITCNNLVKNGRTDYTNFNMRWIGQSVELISDGTDWIVLTNLPNGANEPPVITFS